jgi:hypothetical protein
MAISQRFCKLLRAPAGSRPRIDIDALAEERRHLVGEQATDEIGRPAGRKGD